MALPSQSKYIVGNEACERFSFYGMRSILTLYMTKELLMMEKDAHTVIHLFLAVIYLTPLVGAWLADRFFGRYNCILYISLFYCLGHGILALGDLTQDIQMRQIILLTGLGIIAMGSGGIKPCVSAFVGDQMRGRSEGDMTRMYSAFYWSINLGSFFSFLVIPALRDEYGYGVAFGVPGIFMALATFVFWLGRKQYLHRAPAQPDYVPSLLCSLTRGNDAAESQYGAAQMEETRRTSRNIQRALVVIPVAGALGYLCYEGGSRLFTALGADAWASAGSTLGLFAYLIVLLLAALKLAAVKQAEGFFGVAGHMLFDRTNLAARYEEKSRRDTRNLLRVLASFTLVIPFWALFDQTTSSWILQGTQMQSFSLLGLTIDAERMQSFNPLLVMTLIPLLTLLVYPYIGKFGRPIRRMGFGICLAGVSFLAVAWLQMRLDSGEQLSLMWQGLPYLLLTISEILVSTTGLEYAYTAAGKTLKSTVTSLWYLTITTANLFVVVLTTLVADPVSTSTFMLYSVLAMLAGVLFIFVTTRHVFQPEKEEEVAGI